MMNITMRNFLIILFTAGIILGTMLFAVDILSTYSSAALESTSQNNLQAQSVNQPVNSQTALSEGRSTSTGAIAMASKMGVVPLIIILVFGVQMGLMWLFRKPAQAVRW